LAFGFGCAGGFATLFVFALPDNLTRTAIMR
jgi:hypothetical protein